MYASVHTSGKMSGITFLQTSDIRNKSIHKSMCHTSVGDTRVFSSNGFATLSRITPLRTHGVASKQNCVESHVYSFKRFLYQTYVFPQHSHRPVDFTSRWTSLKVGLKQSSWKVSQKLMKPVKHVVASELLTCHVSKLRAGASESLSTLSPQRSQ